MRRLLILATMIIIMTMPAWSVGTVNQSLAQIPGSTNFVFTENWTADAANGSVPATVISGTISIQGFRIVSVEIAPGSPAPTNLYTVTLTDFSGADILGGSGASQSSTMPSVLPSLSTAPPIYGSLTVNVTGNLVNSAKGSIFVYFAPVSQVIGNTPTGASLTGNNLFTGSNTFQSPSVTTITGTLNSTNLSSGNVMNKSILADGIYYVATAGSDLNDGLSPGSAKGTIAGAQAACVLNQIGNCIIHAEMLRSAVFTSEIDVGRQAEDLNVTLYLPRNSTYTFNITDGTSCGIKQFGKTSIIVEDTPIGNATMTLVPSSNTTNMQALYCTNPSPVAVGNYVNVRGLAVSNTVGATLARGAFVIQHVFDNSRFENVYAQNTNGVAIKVFDSCCAASLWNSEGTATHGTGGIPIQIGDSVLGGSVIAGGVSDMAFNSVSAIDPPTGTSAITFADATGHTSALTFTALHVEAPNSTAPGIQLACNVTQVSILGMSYANLPGGDTTSAAVDIPTCTNLPNDFITGINTATNVGVIDHNQTFTQACTTNGFLKSCSPYISNTTNTGGDLVLNGGKLVTNGNAGLGIQFTSSGTAFRGSGSPGDSTFLDLGNITFRNSNGLTGGSLLSGGSLRSTLALADQGTVCSNGELALSAGWQSTGSATVTAVAGNGQTCSWTITTGTTTAANPTVTDTLTTALPAATTVCEMNIHGGTHTAAAGEGFTQTSLSATAPVFTFIGTPTAGGTTYFVTRRCGP